jgi:hypothetical protein
MLRCIRSSLAPPAADLSVSFIAEACMRPRPSFIASAFALLASSAALTPSTARAQVGGAAASHTSFGILIGSNLSSISDADRGVRDVLGAAFDTKRRVGLNAGIYASIPLFGAVALQPEAHYSQQGVTYESTISGSSAKLGLKVDYVDVPVLIRVDVGNRASHLHPILLLGASGAFRISCSTSATSGSSTFSQQCSENTTSTSTDPIKKYDVAAIGGAGLSLSALGRSYALTVRYSRGLSNISTQSGSNISPKNSVLSLQLSIGN